MGNPFAFTMDFGAGEIEGKNDTLRLGEEDALDPRQPPVHWTVYIKYKRSLLTAYNPLMGLQAEIRGLVTGAAENIFVSLFSEKVVPLVGGCYAVAGVNIPVSLTPFSATATRYGMSVVGVPNSTLAPDYEPLPVAGVPGNFGQIPDYAVAVSASPPNQTIEVLGADAATVVQTLVLGDYLNFAPLHPLGMFIRNTAVLDTLFAFKKKNYFG